MRPLRIIGTILVLLTFLTISGCDENIFSDYSDDTSDEAQMEQALMYLDDGNYAAAKAILLTLNQNDEEVKRALASSYAGTAGLDIPSLITAIDNSSNNGIETVGLVLGDSNNDLTSAEVSSKTSDIEEAISLYEGLTLTDSVKAQLCILHVTRTVLVLAERVGTTQGWPVSLDSGIATVVSGNFDATSVTKINNSVDTLNSYIDSIDDLSGGGSSLREGFDDFLTDIGYSGGITDVEIADFVNGT
ncbi:MAG: hypothetical protein GY714_22430 [Desulfobacterales bacterium]|nr:hypothetical protein [Desulfobacterales bacterium]